MSDKHLSIISKYFLPSINVDSDAVYDMIKGLLNVDGDLKITIITSNVKYKGDLNLDLKYDQTLLKKIEVKTVKPFFRSSKILSDFILGFQLVSLAKKVGNKTIVSLSNPPFISMWHSLLLKSYNFYSWSFDLFPQALVADRILKKENPIYRLLFKLTYKNSPQGLIALGKHQYNYLNNLYNGRSKEIILPCGIHNDFDSSIPEWYENERIILGYLGNIGRAHSPIFLENVLKKVAQSDNIKFVISIYGFHSDRIKKYIYKLNSANIILIGSIPKGHMGFVDVHLVSLLPEWANISVPSKAVSAVCSSSTLWYCGPNYTDTFSFFEECSFYSTENEDSVNETFKSIDIKSIAQKQQMANKIKIDLIDLEKKAYRNIVRSII